VNDHIVGVGGEGPEIAKVATQDSAAGFSHGNDDSVDCRSSVSLSPQTGGSTSKSFGNLLDDIARLQEPVHQGIVARAPGERFDENE